MRLNEVLRTIELSCAPASFQRYAEPGKSSTGKGAVYRIAGKEKQQGVHGGAAPVILVGCTLKC